MTLAVTMGDANGVGPEIVLGAHRDASERFGPLIVVGDRKVLELCRAKLAVDVEIESVEPDGVVRDGVLGVVDLQCLAADQVGPGTVSRAVGQAALRYVERATKLCLDGSTGAVVTMPVNKEATRLSAPDFSGHTEYIAELCGSPPVTMMLTSSTATVTHVSTHVPLREALDAVRRERILQVIRLTHVAVGRWKPNPVIGVAGLNPHAGEHGSFGREEIEEIEPAIVAAREDGIDAIGPLVPDTMMLAARDGRYDAVVCMYHDQGHIPSKLLDFEGGVNVTLGLPIVRTSVDHGTAYDIAWQGRASTVSYLRALEVARRMT